LTRDGFQAYRDEGLKEAIRALAYSPWARQELLLSGAKDWLINRYAAISERVMLQREQGHLRGPRLRSPDSAIEGQIVRLLKSGVSALFYIAVTYKPDIFNMSISEFTFVERAMGDLLSNMSQLQQKLSAGILPDLFRVRNLLECMEMKSCVSRRKDLVKYNSRRHGMKIEAKNVSFSYGKNSLPSLQDVNFIIESGETIGIVGYNGSGP